MGFLPDGYEITEPVSQYMKFKAGENRFRVLSDAIQGWEWWLDKDGNLVPRDAQAGKGGKPKRVRDFKEIAGTPPQYAAKEFWAFVVWNYAFEMVQILEIKQVTIMRPMQAWARNPKWGSPTKYDIIVTRVDGDKTTYEVINEPHSELEADTSKAKNINLEALFSGDDPFKDMDLKEESLSDKEADDISEAIEDDAEELKF